MGIGTGSKVIMDMIQREYPNYHPLVSLARIAHNPDADLTTQFQCHKEIAKYLEPTMKAIDVTTNEPKQTQVRVTLFDVEDVEPVESSSNSLVLSTQS